MTRSNAAVTIVGGGLAGSEAAWQCARRGVPVRIHEMRPRVPTAVHRSARLAELVCSNSFKSLETSSAHGLLKAEMRAAGSLILDAAERARIPAGAALAVDRELFAETVTRTLDEHPLVDVRREEIREIPVEGPVIVATGPLSSEPLSDAIRALTGERNLAFFDAISPIVDGESIDWDVAFRASRYGKGDGSDYVNCPMTREEYDAFRAALLDAEPANVHEFDRKLLFEGCLPIEELARRGDDTLRFGPLKPVGLTDPRTGRRPWAVVQLRQDNLAATHWSMVGFQNRLKWGAQKEVFRLIPGLREARFVKLGMMHRNTYINAPRVIRQTFQFRHREDLFFAGQLSGVEGYTESAASGLLSGVGAVALLTGHSPPVFPAVSALGSIQRYVALADPEHYQPTNVAFGLMPPLDNPRRPRRERKRLMSERALAAVRDYLVESPLFSEQGSATARDGRSTQEEVR
jgi:methylenetetrahydrofolate--tRNA-(uracil-5-)-methyltransferase